MEQPLIKFVIRNLDDIVVGEKTIEYDECVIYLEKTTQNDDRVNRVLGRIKMVVERTIKNYRVFANFNRNRFIVSNISDTYYVIIERGVLKSVKQIPQFSLYESEDGNSAILNVCFLEDEERKCIIVTPHFIFLCQENDQNLKTIKQNPIFYDSNVQDPVMNKKKYSIDIDFECYLYFDAERNKLYYSLTHHKFVYCVDLNLINDGKSLYKSVKKLDIGLSGEEIKLIKRLQNNLYICNEEQFYIYEIQNDDLVNAILPLGDIHLIPCIIACKYVEKINKFLFFSPGMIFFFDVVTTDSKFVTSVMLGSAYSEHEFYGDMEVSENGEFMVVYYNYLEHGRIIIELSYEQDEKIPVSDYRPYGLEMYKHEMFFFIIEDPNKLKRKLELCLKCNKMIQ